MIVISVNTQDSEDSGRDERESEQSHNRDK